MVPKNTVVVLEQLIKFECLVEAYPKAKVSWIFNQKELSLKDNVKFETDQKTGTNYLIISKANISHSGRYRIIASNLVGSVEHNFNIEILGK